MVDNYSAEDLQNAGRLKQIRMVARLVHKGNPRALPIVIGSALGIIVVFVLIGLFVGPLALFIPVGVLLGLVTGMILFGRFAQQAQYAAIDGQLGAAAAVLQSMRGDWTVTPGVTANRTMDVVHRAVGRKGVILVGEGVPARVTGLLASERKRTERVAHGVPIIEFQAGAGEGQVPMSKLQGKITRLPNSLKPAAVSDINYRLKALAPSMQAPKGPLPKGARMPKMPKQQR